MENQETTTTTPEKIVEESKEPSLIERADALQKSLEATEKRVDEKIARFERELAEKILSGRAEIVPTKSQEDQDKETADAVVEQYFG